MKPEEERSLSKSLNSPVTLWDQIAVFLTLLQGFFYIFKVLLSSRDLSTFSKFPISSLVSVTIYIYFIISLTFGNSHNIHMTYRHTYLDYISPRI